MILRLVADDLTGALDTAARFVPLIGPVPVVWPGASIPDGSVAIDAATRELPADQAAETMRRLAPVLASGGIAFKKIDSLLRGNVAAELRACLDCFDHCVLAPAFPFQGRVTRGGRQWVREGDGWRDVGVAPGTLPVRMRDAESDSDLAAIVAAGRRLPDRVLWCGTAGLAGALVGGLPVPRPGLTGPVLALIGSDHPVMRDQVAAARTAGFPDHNLRVIALPVPDGSSRADAACIIARGFADLLARSPRPGVLLVSGGETLRSVCQALGAENAVVDGEFEPGVPCSTLTGGAWPGQRVVSKSGAFGDSALLCRLAGSLQPQ